MLIIAMIHKSCMKHLRSLIAFLLSVALILPVFFFAPVHHSFAASADVAATYATYITVRTTETVSLMSTPDLAAAQQYAVPEGTELVAYALVETDGMYWYTVEYEDLTLYVQAACTELVAQRTDDVSVVDLATPAALGMGEKFSVGGTVSTEYNQLDKVTVSVHKHSYLDATPVISATDTTGSLEKMSSSLSFDQLSSGAYTLQLTAEVTSYYLDGSDSLATATQTVLLHRKPLVISDQVGPDQALAMGIDVSSWLGSIDWATVAQQIDFSIVHISSKLTLDKRFAENAKGCMDNDIPYGVYHVSYATNVEEAIAEAQFVIDALAGYEPVLGVFFDVEYRLHDALTSEQLQAVTRAFCDTVQAAGYEPGLYSYTELFDEHYSDAYFSTIPKWVSEIDADNCSYSGGVTMWQYTWGGRISGISGDVDCNYYYATLSNQDAVCAHEQCEYTFVDNTHIVTCTVCGMRATTPGEENKPFKFNTIGLSLASDISVVYKATVPAGFTNPYVVYEVNGEKIFDRDYTVDKTTGRYVFRYEGINPQLMGDKINATLYATLDGMEVSCSYLNYSVLSYCKKWIEDSGSSPELKALCSDLLVYGAMAQIQKDYKVDELVTDDLNLYSTEFPGVDALVDRMRIDNQENENDIHDVATASLMLSNRVAFRFGFKLDDPELYEYRVCIKGDIYTYSASDLTYNEENGRYYLNFSELIASEFDEPVTVSVWLNGKLVSRSLTFSVNTYIKIKGGTDDDIGNLVKALYNYGKSAEKYVAAD